MAKIVVQKLNILILNIVSLFARNNGVGPAHGDSIEIISEGGLDRLFNTIWQTLKDFFAGIFDNILKLLGTLIYLICKLCLNIVDFLSIFIQEFMGISTAENIANNTSFEETDIIFRFIFSSTIQKVILSIFALSFVLLIIFTIIAIIRNEWQAVVENKSTKVSKVIVKTLKALFLMLFVPVMVIFGVVFSNVILVSGINAIKTNAGAGNLSIGGEIFVASTYSANQYRVYAENNKKIPILYDFSGGFGTDEKIINQSQISQNPLDRYSLERIMAAKNMMLFGKFNDITTIDDKNEYYSNYDGNIKTKQIEYFAMADYIDFAIRTGASFYIKNVEDVHTSINEALNNMTGTYTTDFKAYANIFEMTNNSSGIITAYDKDGKLVSNTYDEEGNTVKYSIEDIWDYKFTVKYSPRYVSEEKDIDSSGEYTYSSIRGTYDEFFGSKYIVCMKFNYRYGNVNAPEETSVYLPITKGANINGVIFDSAYLTYDSPFIARGMFNFNNYPTAIRENGNIIEFYRQNLSVISYASIAPEVYYNSSSDTTDASSLIPNINFNEDSTTVYFKNDVVSASLENGLFALNYNFSQSGYNIQNIYKLGDINFLILIFASLTLISIFFKVIIGLIVRIYDLALLYLTFPTFLSTYPLDEGGRFKKWTTNFIQRVISTYSIFLTVSIVLMLVPLVSQIQLFSETNLSNTSMMGRLINSSLGIDFLNMVTRVLFILVLFTMIKTSTSLLQEIFNANAGKNFEIIATGEGLIGKDSKVKALIATTASVFTGKAAIDMAKKISGDIKGSIPGGSFVAEGFQKLKYGNKNRKTLKTGRDNFRSALSTPPRGGAGGGAPGGAGGGSPGGAGGGSPGGSPGGAGGGAPGGAGGGTP